jgi:Tol biopolymer transport system component
VFVMNADGSNPVNLTDSPFQEVGGAWSPDGTKIVFGQQKIGDASIGDIFVINADGTGLVNITHGDDFFDHYLHWSCGTGALGSEVPSEPGPGSAGGG